MIEQFFFFVFFCFSFCLFVCLNIYKSSNFFYIFKFGNPEPGSFELSVSIFPFQGSVIQNLAVVNVCCHCQFPRSWSSKDLASLWIGLVR